MYMLLQAMFSRVSGAMFPSSDIWYFTYAYKAYIYHLYRNKMVFRVLLIGFMMYVQRTPKRFRIS